MNQLRSIYPVNNQPKLDDVLVIMPTYYRGALISDSICSIRKQSYTNWNLLVVDDAPDDKETELIVTKISREDPRISYIKRVRGENDLHTSSNAINEGIRSVVFPEGQFYKAWGKKVDFITQVHSDDFLSLYSLEVRRAVIKNNSNVSAVYTDALRFNEKTKKVKIWRGYDPGNLHYLLKRTHVQNIPHFTFMWRSTVVRDIWESNNGEFYDSNIGYGEDRDVSALTIEYAIANNMELSYLRGFTGSIYRENESSISSETDHSSRKKQEQYVENKHFNKIGSIGLALRRLVDRPTYRLPYTFRKKYLKSLEQKLYSSETYDLDTYWEQILYWFK